MVSVAFVGSQRMRVLNRAYHGEDRATDVLAFGQAERGRSERERQTRGASGPPALQPSPSFDRACASAPFLGEIIICPRVAQQNALQAHETWRREIIRLLVHGTLHLLGYDHARAADADVMFQLQERLVRTLASSS